MITIKEMANILGISTTTVSNVIHGKTKEVSPETIKKVQKVIEEYRYVPNINARNLASNRTKVIGVGLMYTEHRNKYYLMDAFVGELMGSIEKEMKRYGYFVMIYFSNDAEELLNTMLSWNVDGVIILGTSPEECKMISEKYRKPKVFIDCYYPSLQKNVINIGLDDKKGGYLMGKHLIECGHRKIAYVCDNLRGPDFERYTGLIMAMQEEGLAFEAEDYISLDYESGTFEEHLESLFTRLMQYTAIFCASDYYALRLLNFLRDKGVSIPEDISIAGYDDNMYSRLSRPAITTIHQDPTEKGKLAAKYIVERIEEKTNGVGLTILPVHLVKRDTVKKISKKSNSKKK